MLEVPSRPAAEHPRDLSFKSGSYVRARVADAALLAVSALVSGLLILLWIVALPRRLDVSTTTIGYPVHADFDIDSYFTAYHIVVVGWPLLTALVFLASSWVVRRRVLHREPWLGEFRSRGSAVPMPPARARPPLLTPHLAAGGLVGATPGGTRRASPS